MNKNIFSSIKSALDHNAPTIATFGSIVGVGLTIFFMHRASSEAARAEDSYNRKHVDLVGKYATEEKPDGTLVVPAEKEKEFKEEVARAKMDKNMRLVIIYRWALLSGFSSIALALLSNYLNGMQIAGLGTLLALNQDKLQKGGEKLKEMIGEEKFKEFQENIEKDILGEKIANNTAKVETSRHSSDDDTPFEDYKEYCVPWSGERYRAPQKLVESMIEKGNEMFNGKATYLTYDAWRGMLRIPSAPAWHPYVWNANHPFKAHIGRVDFDGGVCMDAIIFDNRPVIDPTRAR